VIGVEVIERLLALQAAPPFRALDPAELLLIASHARFREFDAGQLILKAGAVSDTLYVRAAGVATAAGRPAPAVFDAPGLLFGLAASADHIAGPDGFRALVLAKPHVFTIARECPEFVVALRDTADGAGS
jgi:CRP-like cAMP-binding protein